MKNFLLKFGNVASWTIVGATGLYSLAALLYGVLPMEVTEPIVTAFNTNTAVIIPTGINTAVTGVVLATAKILGRSLNLKLKDSTLNHELWRTQTETKIAQRQILNEEVNSLTVEKQNIIIAQNETIIKNQNALVAFSVIQAERSKLSSFTPQPIKDMIKIELANLKNIDFNITPITKVITETIEVEVEKVTTAGDRL